ncbi:MAG: DUF4124 domain-containing protein [Geobacteraceae bacterium]|nr:DUF4124 domain-containing protein [Geobacteraceae bacterium]
MSKITLVLVGLVVLFASSALAETYTWVDSSGTVNFSDDLSQVPRKYRKKVKTRGDMGPGMPVAEETPASNEKAEVAKDNEKGSAGKSDKAAKSDKSTKPDKKDALYGGKSGANWKKEFDSVRDQIEAVDKQMEANNKRMSQGKMTRSEYLSNEYSNRSLQQKRNELIGKLESLNEQATKAGLPSEFR